MWKLGLGCAPSDGLHLADKVGLEAAGRIVPLQAFAIAIPQLEAVLLLAVLVAEIVWLAGIPVGERDGPARGHPKVVALVGQICARYPEMLVAQTCERVVRLVPTDKGKQLNFYSVINYAHFSFDLGVFV